MRKHRAFRTLKFLAIAIVAVALFGIIVEHLWNWLVPGIFGLHAITFVQALGLLILSKILFSGFHGKGHRGGHWNRHMDERWANMTAEERERFRAGMRGRHWCDRGEPSPGPTPDQTGA